MERKEAIEVVKKNWSDSSFTMLREALETLVPELKESENEKIRKALIHLVEKSNEQGGYALHKDEARKMLDWLEKQGEQKLSETTDLKIWKYIVDAVLTEREGIGQYIDSPWTTEVAEKLQKRFGNIEQEPEYPLAHEKMETERWKEACKAACCDRNYRSHYGLTETRDDYFVDGVQWADEHPKSIVWSDEDENKRHALQVFLTHCYGMELDVEHGCYGYDELCSWLSSIHPQQKQEWSEQDEKLRLQCLDLITHFPSPNGKIDWTGCQDWLKSLKDRVQPQPKQEWSEEDGKRIEQICEDLQCGMENRNAHKIVRALHYDEIILSNISWLKSLSPQNHWKPTEMQLKCLKDACDEHFDLDGLDPLYTLYEQLKAL